MATSTATDPYSTLNGQPVFASASNAAAVTPSDTQDLSFVTIGLYVGTAGNVAVNMAGTGTTIVFVGVVAGSVLPIRVSRVLTSANGTTASNIVALW